MAELWLADDEELGRQVVVKLLAPEADRERFEREARAVAALSHPNIVQLFDFGEEDRWYMVFEYLRGGSLEERLAEVGALPGDEVARIARDVATGLAHAHSRGVVHRDLKPGNVLFDTEGRSKIADFGIARVQGVDTLTEDGTILGTAAYISPEQVRGEPVTPASDVYAFGVILYRLLAGRLPFEADSPMQLAALHRDADPPPLPTSDDDRSRALAAVAMSALAKEPSRRPADGAALLHSLNDRTLAGAATTDVIHAPVPPAGRARRRVPLAAGVVATFVLAGCGAVAAMLLTDNPASAPAVTGPKRPAHHTPTTTSPSNAQTTPTHSPTTTTRHSIPTTTASRTATARPTTAARTTSPVATTVVTTVPPTTTPPTTAVTTQPETTPATTTPTP